MRCLAGGLQEITEDRRCDSFHLTSFGRKATKLIPTRRWHEHAVLIGPCGVASRPHADLLPAQ